MILHKFKCQVPIHQGEMKKATITSLDAGSMMAGIQVHPVGPGHKTVSGLTQSLVNTQTVQVIYYTHDTHTHYTHGYAGSHS